MIGREEWFTRRKYSGWGLTPTTKQGYIYVFAIIILLFILSNLPVSTDVKMTLVSGFIILIIIDVLHIMASIKMDERETKIEALSERNASWTMVGTIALLIFYFSFTDIVLSSKELMPYIIAPMITGLIVKSLTSFILQKKDL